MITHPAAFSRLPPRPSNEVSPLASAGPRSELLACTSPPPLPFRAVAVAGHVQHHRFWRSTVDSQLEPHVMDSTPSPRSVGVASPLSVSVRLGASRGNRAVRGSPSAMLGRRPAPRSIHDSRFTILPAAACHQAGASSSSSVWHTRGRRSTRSTWLARSLSWLRGSAVSAVRVRRRL